MAERVGARSRAAVGGALLRRLERGEDETRTLAELLTVDLAKLAGQVLDARAAAAMRAVADAGVVARMRRGGEVLLARVGIDGVERFARHRSDLVRGWAAWSIGVADAVPLDERLRRLRVAADDANAGVREWAWMAARPWIAADPRAAIARLAPWTADSSANLRRFASEATRPRGVWCAHVAALRDAPELGLPILEPLRADPARYVQDSVGNWLNDAAKSRPAWVRTLTKRWSRGGDAATARIVRRALRSL